jgi:hypothetical protein
MTDTSKDHSEEESYRAEIRERLAHDSATKSKKTTQGKFGLIVIIIIILAFFVYGFFNFGGSTSTGNTSSIILPSISEHPEVGEDKVSLDKLTKGFNDNSYTPQITFGLTFTNNTDKDIRGFEGIVTFSDIFDNKIQSVKFSYDQGLQSHYEVTLEKAIDYNRFIDADRKLNETEEKNLKYKWQVTTILYQDGAKEIY